MPKPEPVFQPEKYTPEDLADLSREVTVTLTKENWALISGFLDADGVMFRRDGDYDLGTQASRISHEIDRQVGVSQEFIRIVEGGS